MSDQPTAPQEESPMMQRMRKAMERKRLLREQIKNGTADPEEQRRYEQRLQEVREIDPNQI